MAHNREIGSKDTSSHPKGVAADIACLSDSNRYKIEEALKAVGITRIGHGKDFIHADDDQDKPQKRIWVYS